MYTEAWSYYLFFPVALSYDGKNLRLSIYTSRALNFTDTRADTRAVSSPLADLMYQFVYQFHYKLGIQFESSFHTAWTIEIKLEATLQDWNEMN